jgi:RHS repeat-associated protein
MLLFRNGSVKVIPPKMNKLKLLIAIFSTCYTLTNAQSTVYLPHYNNMSFTKTIDATKPVGCVVGTHQVAGTGAASYMIPIVLPPGTAGVIPSIGIGYNSQAGNAQLGYGWSISGLSAISRVPKNHYNDAVVKGINYSADDDYSLDGNRLVLQSGTNGTIGAIYATENETYSKIEISNDCGNGPWVFDVTTKDGTVMEYGNEDIAKGASVNNSGNWVYWRLYKVIDKNGNYVEYIYDNTDNDSRIKEIRYTGNAATGLLPYNKIVFNYTERIDKNKVYEAGLSYEQKYLLSNITITGENNASFKVYTLKYSTDDMFSFLTEVEEAGKDGTKLNSTIFKYGDKPTDMTVQTQNCINGIVHDKASGDFDGDGYTDLLTTGFSYVNGVKVISDFRIWKRTASSSSFVQSTPLTLLTGNFEINNNPINLYNSIAADFDGDGRDDILMAKTINNASGSKKLEFISIYYPNVGATSVGTPINYYPPTLTTGFWTGLFNGINALSPNYLTVGDFDGDGKSDYLTYLGNGGVQKIFYSRPGIADNEIVEDPYCVCNSTGTKFSYADANYAIDFNGDGKSDIMRITDGLCEIFEVVKSISGTPWELRRIYSRNYPTDGHNVYFGDINGDRKTDLLTIDATGNKEIAYSTGLDYDVSTFAFTTSLTMSVPMLNSDHKILIADYNGDGLADIGHCHSHMVGGSASTSKINIYYSTGKQFYYKQYNHLSPFALVQPLAVDFNGDGRAEIINHLNYMSDMEVLEIKPHGTERLLHKVTNGFNQTIEFNYERLTKAGTFYDRGNGGNSTYPLNTIQYPIYAVQQVKIPDGIGGFNKIDYRYEEARMHRAGRGYLGFTKVIASDYKSNVLTAIENTFDLTYYIPLQFKVKLNQVNNGLALSDEQSAYNLTAIAGPGKRYKLELVAKTSKNILQNIVQNSTNTYDNYGNITQNVTSINGGFETKTVNTTYGAFGSLVKYLPTSIEAKNVRSGRPMVTKNTKLDYNTAGKVIKITEFAGLPMEVNTEFTYNAYGLKVTEKVSATGVSPRTTTYGYDYLNRFLVEKDKACTSCGSTFAVRESYGYEPLFGNKIYAISTDCNSTVFKYDAFGQLIKTTYPTGATEEIKNIWDITTSNLYRTEVVHSGKPDITTWFDALNREVKTETQLAGTSVATTKSTYNSIGLIKTKTNAYIDGVEIPLISSFTYDINGRLITEVTPTNTSNYSYNFNTSFSTLAIKKIDAQGSYNIKTTDATGQVKSTEDLGGKVVFNYDSWGNQIEIFQNGTLVTTKVFDGYNRLKWINEINAGTINYSYDAFGQLVTQQDASSNSYSFSYDDLGRMTKRTGTEGTTEYQYYCSAKPIVSLEDFKGNGIPGDGGGKEVPVLGGPKQPLFIACCNGNLTRIVSFNGITQDFTYDSYGRLVQKDEKIDGINYTTGYTYDVNNNITSTKYPDNLEIRYIFDSDSYLKQVERVGSTGFIYQTQTSNGMGQITKYKLGNGLTTDLSYSFGLLTTDKTISVQDFKYTWDIARGNPTKREDLLRTLSESFSYDNLDRLTGAQVLGQAIQTFNYDPHLAIGNTIGNIIANTESGFYRHTAQQIHTPSSISHFTSTVLPPANISGNTQSIEYTPFHRVDHITENGYDQKFDYWPSYNRVKSQLYKAGVLQNTRLYFADFEIQIDASSKPTYIHYVHGALGLCAIITVDANSYITENYVYKDYLGSLTTLTNASGAVIANKSFDAWGRARNPANWTYVGLPVHPKWLYRGYTGHEDMPEFALINMNARLYDPVVGKMISPDILVSKPYSSQAYNRYAYANNNPMKYIDPDGNFALQWLWGFVKGFAKSKNGVHEQGHKTLFGDAFASANRHASNSIKINVGLFVWDQNYSGKGDVWRDIWQVVSRFTWELPQTLVGYGASEIHNLFGKVDDVAYAGGATIVHGGSPFGGITIGSYINGGEDIATSFNPSTGNLSLLLHEYGHYMQSQNSGYVYLGMYGIPSLLSAQFGTDHNNYWTEQDADFRSNNYSMQHYGFALNPTLATSAVNPRWYDYLTGIQLIMPWYW